MTPDAMQALLQDRAADLPPLKRMLLDQLMAGGTMAEEAAPASEAEALEDRVEALTEMVDRFAAAVGACPGCFGTDAGCPTCGGRGAPGSRRPEADAFAFFVAPVLRRLDRSPGGAQTRHRMRTITERPARPVVINHPTKGETG